MKKKALVLAVCMAIAAPTIGAAKILPNDFVGISFGEIEPKSFLGEPFKGSIPILFTDFKSSKNLQVRIAPRTFFEKVGAEKLPILDSLNFQVQVQNNKPVILISSTQPIQEPFLNFILEIETPNGLVYQDYTTLLGPKNHAESIFSRNDSIENNETSVADYQLLPPISTLSSIKLENDRLYTVKSGDTLSEIAKALNSADTSLKRMIKAIHQKNPKAFVQNDINRLKAGNVLKIPDEKELSNSKFQAIAKAEINKKTTKHQPKEFTFQNNVHIIKKGDSLSAITKTVASNGVSFTKMMNAIYAANPHAFSKNRINILKIGEVLRIPSLIDSSKEEVTGVTASNLILEDALIKENISEFKLDGFIIEKGDTLASVSKQIGYKNIPQAKMMKAIYLANPEAFEKNNITMLIEGSIIRLPSVYEIENVIKNKVPNTKDKVYQPKEESQSNKATSNSKDRSAVALNKLEKRVRELKKDLDEADTNFSNLEATLLSKEGIIKTQSEHLQQLAMSLSFIKNNKITTPQKNSITNTTKKLSRIRHSPSIKESTKNRGVMLVSTTKETLPLTIEEELLAARTDKSYVPENANEQMAYITNNLLKEYGVYISGKELLSTTLALLLGLLLIRYRREIYSYTSISYDHPNYYPPFDEATAKAVLKERPITFHDTMLSTHKSSSKFSGEHINECEELVEELIDDLNIKTNNNENNADWDHLNKACDDYIAQYRNEQNLKGSDLNDGVNDNTPTEEMSFELFEALAEGVITQEKNTPSDNSYEPPIYGLDDKIVPLQEQASSIPPIFDELVKLSENTEVKKLYLK